MKHRRNKVKREHGIIQNALLWLEKLGRLSDVTDIIPGVIDVNRSSERGIVYKYETQTGCKLLLKSNGSIQEAFVITKNPARVQEWIEKEFPSTPPATASQVIAPSNLQAGPKKKLSNIPLEQKLRSELATCPRRSHSNKRLKENTSKSSFGNVKTSNVANRLDRSTLKALSILKKSLQNVKLKDAKMNYEKSPYDDT